MADNNVSLHRVLKAAPEKVFRAFTDAIAIASWLPPHGFLCTVHELNVQAGGSFRMSFHNFSTSFLLSPSFPFLLFWQYFLLLLEDFHPM